MKLFKNHDKEPFLFLVNDTNLPFDNSLGTYYEMTASQKVKTVDNKVKQNKAQYNLDK